LPFEQLKVFRDLPAKAKDFSLFCQMKRLKAIGFKQELSNSTGIARTGIKYATYSFKIPANVPDCYNGEAHIVSALKAIPNVKVEGVVSGLRVASLEEWQQYLKRGSLIIYYGNPGFLSIFSPKLLLNMSETAKNTAFIIFDKINCKKTYIEKHGSLEAKGMKTPVLDQLINSAVILTLLDTAVICATQWSVEAT